jgi:hypothetical protein
MHRRIMAVEAAEYHRREFAASRRAYGPMITELLDEGLTIAAVDYAAALAHQRRFRRLVPTLLENVDALIVPSTDTTAPATLTTTGTLKFQAPWSYTGVPVVSIPCGLASDRMPAAVQLVGRYHQEASSRRFWHSSPLKKERVSAIVCHCFAEAVLFAEKYGQHCFCEAVAHLFQRADSPSGGTGVSPVLGPAGQGNTPDGPTT